MSVKQILIVVIVISALGCKNRYKAAFPPPEDANKSTPVRHFSLSKPETLLWTEIPSDSIGKSIIKKLNFNSLTSKPFDIGDVSSLSKPIDEKKIDWNSVPDTIFDIKNLPTEKLSFKTIILENPIILKPIISPNTINGVRGLSDFKLPKDVMGKIRCSLIDENGFIWIGTEKGLFRYDGNTVEAYEKNKGLPNLDITYLFSDRNNRIWIGTIRGDLYVFDKKSGIIQMLETTFIKSQTYGILEDKAGKIWVPMGGIGMLIIDTDSNYVKQFTQKNGLSGTFTVRPYQDKDGNIWLPTENGITVVNQHSKSIKRISGDNILYGKGSRAFVAGVIQDTATSEYYITGAPGFQILNLQNGTNKKIDEGHGLSDTTGTVEHYMDRSGKIWIGGTNGAVFTFERSTNKIKKLNVAPGENKIFYNFNEDEKGQMWIGSINDGLYIYNPNAGKPANFTTANGLGNNRIWATLEDKNKLIWIGTYDGIDIYNPFKKTLKHISKSNGLPDAAANNLTIDANNRIWASGLQGGFAEIDPENDKIISHGNNGILKNIRIRSIYSISNGDIWMGTNESEIIVYNPQQKTIKKYRDTIDRAEFAINQIYQDKKGLIWVLSNGNGIKVIDPKTNTLRKLTKTEGLTTNNIITLAESKDEMWIGSADSGIDVLNFTDSTITSINKTTGLPNEDIWTLNEWNDKMYAGTTNGLAVINIVGNKSGQSKSLNIYNIGRDQGLNYVDFAANSSLISSDNQLWAGVDNQILTIIDEPVSDTSTIPTFITGFNLFDKPIEIPDISLSKYLATADTIWKSDIDSVITDTQGYLKAMTSEHVKYTYDSIEATSNLPVNLSLPSDQNYVSFSFTGRQYNAPNDISYRYFLEGIDKTWSTESKNNKSENYRDLPPGEYTFKVICKGISGKWSSPAELSFTILPPWWRTWWAYLIYLILAGIGARRIHLFQKERTIKKEQEKIKDRELQHAKEIAKAFKELGIAHENLKSTQAQLIQSEKMASLGELTAGIAHEIQNPMNFVNNFSEVCIELIDEMKTDLNDGNKKEAISIANDIQQNLEKILHHGKRADSIVKGMLQHSRNSNSAKEMTDINALADEYLRLAYHGLRAKNKAFNATIKTDLDANLGKVSIIAQDIGRVILNLITNAFYAVTEKKNLQTEGFEPTVTVTTKKQGERIFIKVADNGMGIPNKVLDKIFQPFFTTKPTGQGTGLGLSLSYDIVKSHGGDIKVETTEGMGTEFTIELPA
jgi:signal transduction histidine kinase/ligand-binding sensor domain-containing protein